jgi:ATP-dependent HslUV protease ATP-binding subunit HslU
MVKAEKRDDVLEKAKANSEDKLLDLLLPKPKGYADSAEDSETREKFRKLLREGKLDERLVDIEVDEAGPQVEVLTNTGMEDLGMNLQDMFKNIFPSKKRRKKVKIKEARSIILQQEVNRLIDMEEVKSDALKRVEQSGIIFLDEIDKVCSGSQGGYKSADVSREGVQRDLLPIIEGSTVMTKYGMVKTDHILFIAAGAFHIARPSDLVPELQGRFPIRVELDSLTKQDFVEILKEPENALTKQYQALLEADNVEIIFCDDGIDRLAEIATEVNKTNENIGARRLHTILERLLEDISFQAPDIEKNKVEINAEYVDLKLSDVVQDQDLSKYIL